MQTHIVELTKEEAINCVLNGGIRQLRNCRNGKAENGTDHGGESVRDVSVRLADSIIGEFGEVAVARHFNFYHTRGSTAPSHGDVGDIEVKTTEYQNGGLILHRSSPDAPHVLVRVIIGRTFKCELVGWWDASVEPDDRFWRDDFDPPAWLIPESELRAVSELEQPTSGQENADTPINQDDLFGAPVA